MDRHSKTISTPNIHLQEARRRLPSPNRVGKWMSRSELVTAVNAYLHANQVLDVDVDLNYIGKLEAGKHRWPRDARRRQALRVVLQVNTDADIGFYPYRRGKADDDRGMFAISDPLPTNAAVAKESTELSAAKPEPDDLGLHWAPDLGTTVDLVGNLWKADMQRRQLVVSAAWTTMGFAAPTRDWLLGLAQLDPARLAGRRVGDAEVEALWSICQTFTDIDHRLGGGHARSTLSHYLTTAVLPILNGSYARATGQRLFGAAARLCDLGGFMAFDCGLHGLAQRYFIQALHLAQISGDRALGAHILADMSMHAHHQGEAREALALAAAGQRTSRDCGSLATLARSYAMEARAHALLGDARACGAAMNHAEHALEAAHGDEPGWISFFTYEQLAAEFMYAASDLGRHNDVQRFAPSVLAAPDGMQRRFVLASLTLAASHIGDEGRPNDIDQACLVLRQAAPAAVGLSSPRATSKLNAVRSLLRPYQARPTVQALDHMLTEMFGAAD